MLHALACCAQAHVALKVIRADAYKEYKDLVEREIMVRARCRQLAVRIELAELFVQAVRSAGVRVGGQEPEGCRAEQSVMQALGKGPSATQQLMAQHSS